MYYFEVNFVKDGNVEVWFCNEWCVWWEVVCFDLMMVEYMIFGDYVVDCVKMLFSGGGVFVICYICYMMLGVW